MTVGMQPVTLEALRYIVHNMRARDRQEIFALRWNDDEEALVHNICEMAGDLWNLWSWDNEPIAVNCLIPARPGVVIVGAFGTDKWRLVLKALTRWTRDFAIPVLKNSNYHRGETYVMASHTDSRRWIELLGGEVEALLKGYGKNREDFLLYAWDLTREGDHHVLRRRGRRIERSANVTSQRWPG